jgi:flagellar biosynthesis/type III secretory pathway protein FliH
MGYIVKTKQAAGAPEGPRLLDTDQVAAEVAEVLLAARVAANAERASARDAALLLARKMAEKIVGRAVELDPQVMADIASQALLASRARGSTVVLRVHPEDLAAVETAQPQWLEREGTPAEVRMVADETVGRYGCVVETAVGRVDARLATQLDLLERVLGGKAPRG